MHSYTNTKIGCLCCVAQKMINKERGFKWQVDIREVVGSGGASMSGGTMEVNNTVGANSTRETSKNTKTNNTLEANNTNVQIMRCYSFWENHGCEQYHKCKQYHIYVKLPLVKTNTTTINYSAHEHGRETNRIHNFECLLFLLHKL